MLVTIEIDPARRTAAFREVSYLAAGDSCRVVLDGVRGADFGTLKLMLYRDAASESPVASCVAFSQVPNHPSLADGLLALDTVEMAEWFADAVPEESDSDSDSVAPAAPVSQKEPRLAARASLAERSVRAEGWLVAFDSDRVWAACRVPVLLRPGAGTSGAADPVSVAALVEALVGAAMEESAEAVVAAALSSKADKVPSASAGNLASLDADGNLLDSGATPASIKAAAVAEVVANAPGTMDTLKEIADILGSSQQSGTVLKRLSDLETGKADSSSLAAVATSGSYNDLSDKPTIPTVPTPISPSTDQSAQGKPADAKAVGDALRSGFTEWVCDEISDGWTFVSCEWDTVSEIGTGWFANLANGSITISAFLGGNADSVNLEKEAQGNNPGVELSRHLVTPTKTSQLTNDGDGTNGPYASIAQIPAVDGSLNTPGAAADAKAVGDALRGGFTEWVCEPPTYNGRDVEVKPFVSQLFMGFWRLQYVSDGVVIAVMPMDVDDDRLELDFEDVEVTATRQAFPPTKTSQLANDGAPNGGGNAYVMTNDTRLSDARTPTAHVHAVADVTGLAAALSQKANASDLPYALVEPGKWEFSGLPSGVTAVSMSYSNYTWILELSDSTTLSASSGGGEDLIVEFYGGSGTVTATRPSLPGHLLDRAGNRVVVSGDTTLTLPAAVAGYLRDFLVRLEISGSTVPTITFSPNGNESVTYETDGDEFPVPDEAGDWLYSFTESCVAHKFAVSLKKVNEVAAPQAQGGS